MLGGERNMGELQMEHKDTISRNTKGSEFRVSHLSLKAVAIMLWGMAITFAVARITSSASLNTNSGAWFANDAIVWPVFILLTVVGISLWHKKKWGALLFALLGVIGVVDLLTNTSNSCLALSVALVCVNFELRLLWLWREKQLTW